MMERDYKKLGLKCGLEIHQQLEGQKLFCSCPTILRDDAPHFTFIRRLRASAGETGEIDVAALHEMQKELSFVYEGYKDTNCLVETDEEPPHDLNQEALKATLETAKILNANVIDELQVMRKTVVDGSNTSGFQRTALVARNGYLLTKHGRVSIPTISLEEDACRIMNENVGHQHVVYRLDRLGIPLIEIGTGPEISTPEMAKEVAEQLGMILRSTGKVKRGLGTIRQDVNVSIAGGQRIEIKGAQDLKMIPTLVEFEVQRQSNLLKITEDLKKNNAKIEGKVHNIAELMKKSESKVISSAIQKNGVILAIKLDNFAGFIGREVQPNRRLGTEFSERAKVKAHIGGIFHSDELPKYGITEDEVKKIRETLFCKPNDAFVMVADAADKSNHAMEAVIERARDALVGVPKEVRKANDDGTTSYLRPMPGAARLYPETDVRPIKPNVSGIKIPELLTEKAERFVKQYELGKDLAELVAWSSEGDVFEQFAKEFKSLKPAFIAETMMSIDKLVKKKYNVDVSPDTHDFKAVFHALEKGIIAKESLVDLFADLGRTKQMNIDKFRVMNEDELKIKVKNIISLNPTLIESQLIGKAMDELRGKAEANRIIELVKKLKK